jgi:hypothetical protein
MGRTKREPLARREAVRTGPPADPTTILARLTPEERGWFIDILDRLRTVEVVLRTVEVVLEKHAVALKVFDLGEQARQICMVRGFLDGMLFGYPRPGCAHRETPIPELRKGGKK